MASADPGSRQGRLRSGAGKQCQVLWVCSSSKHTCMCMQHMLYTVVQHSPAIQRLRQVASGQRFADPRPSLVMYGEAGRPIGKCCMFCMRIAGAQGVCE
jgi:hypothetical protein